LNANSRVKFSVAKSKEGAYLGSIFFYVNACQGISQEMDGQATSVKKRRKLSVSKGQDVERSTFELNHVVLVNLNEDSYNFDDVRRTM
jgi:hypothetical protein